MSVGKLNSFFLFVLVLGLFLVSGALSCGEIHDGPERGEDIDSQTETTKYWVNWEGFPDDEDVEIAIISERIAFKPILDNVNCRLEKGFCGSPDVYGFRSVKKSLGDLEIDKLHLERGQHYYAVIKFKDGKETRYASSDGLGIDQQVDDNDDDGGERTIEDDDDDSSPRPPPVRSFVERSSSSSGDDDDDLEDWEIGLIAMGCALCCLLLLLLILLVVAKGKGEDKYTTTVHRNDNVDKL